MLSYYSAFDCNVSLLPLSFPYEDYISLSSLGSAFL